MLHLTQKGYKFKFTSQSITWQAEMYKRMECQNPSDCKDADLVELTAAKRASCENTTQADLVFVPYNLRVSK